MYRWTFCCHNWTWNFQSLHNECSFHIWIATISNVVNVESRQEIKCVVLYLLQGLLSEHYDKHPVFILKDVKFKELKAMMDYMYRGEVNISQDQLAALLKAAESLQIKGLSESKTGGSKTSDTRQTKVSQITTQPSSDIPQSSSHLTIEKNKVPRQSSAVDLPEDSASPQISKGLSSR